MLKFKYLGVVVDDKLSWKSHVTYVGSKAGKTIGLRSRLRKELTTCYETHIPSTWWSAVYVIMN